MQHGIMLRVEVAWARMTLTISAALERARSGDPPAQLAVSKFFFERNDLASARLWAGLAADAGLSEALLPAAQLELVALMQGGQLAAAEQRAQAAVRAHVANSAQVLATIRILRASDTDAALAEAIDLLRADAGYRAMVQELSTIREFRSTSRTRPERPAGETIQVHAYSRFLPESTLSWLDKLSQPLLRPAHVIDPLTGQRRIHPVRRGDQAVLDWQMLDPVAAAVLRAVAETAACDWRCCEPVNLLRYRVGGEYRLHHDCLEHDPLAQTSDAGRQPLNQRITTALLYLNEDVTGGSTAFPGLGLELPAARNRLLVFGNLRDGRPDPAMRHAGMPVLAGEKRVLSFWFRERPLVDASHAGGT